MERAMKQFELKFTEENLQRHLAYDSVVVTTIRDKIKADIGDVTIIKSNIYSLTNITPITMNELALQVRYPELWVKEGFSSYYEFIEEIQRMYGHNPEKQLFIHHLCKLIGIKQIHNPVTDKYYPIRDRSAKQPQNNIKGLWEEQQSPVRARKCITCPDFPKCGKNHVMRYSAELGFHCIPMDDGWMHVLCEYSHFCRQKDVNGYCSTNNINCRYGRLT